MDRKTILGVEYYRPPNPSIEYFGFDIKKIKKAGLSVIRTWFHWQQVNPSEGKWDFTNYDKLLKEAGKNNIKVLLQLNIEVPPEWLVKKYPEGRWVNSEGIPYNPHSVAMAQVGTYPGLCPDYPPVRKHMEDFLLHTAEHYREHPALYGYDVWNEIMPFYGVKSIHNYLYHPETKKKFAAWLKKRYEDISLLNHIYGGRNYESFDDVPVPSEEGITVELIDFYEFAGDWILDYLKWKVNTVKKIDKGHPVVSHPGSGPGAVIYQPYDPCEMAAAVDKWGASCYEIYFWTAAFLAALTRGACKGKEWGFVEMCGSRTWWGPYGSKLRTPEFLEQLVLLPISYGGRFNMFWQWRHERFGQESPNFGLVDEDGAFNKRTERIANLAQKILDKQDFFDGLEFPPGDVGLLIDLRSIFLEYASNLSDRDRLILFEYLGWFYSLSRAGVNVEILYGSDIAKNGIPPNIKLLVAPILNIEREGIMEALKKFAESEGNIIAGPYLFTFDRFSYMNEKVPPGCMQKIFGSKRVEVIFQKDILLEIPDIAPGLKLPGYHSLELYECTDAEPWAFSGGNISGTLRKKGKAGYYRLGSCVGTPAGKAICFPDDANEEISKISAGLETLCFNLALSSGCYIHKVRATGNVLLRVCKSSRGENVVFVHNPEESQQDIWLIPEFRIKKVMDVIKNKVVHIKDNRVFISLKGRESSLLILD
ncbi:MAG TPA: beta-galactosidase [bacterium]|nr:beta-galactosidase [bacterium]HPP29638.1 beta-galactosidase [bacterium]